MKKSNWLKTADCSVTRPILLDSAGSCAQKMLLSETFLTHLLFSLFKNHDPFFMAQILESNIRIKQELLKVGNI